MESLTPKQQMVLDFIKKTCLEKGFPPSVREICAGVGLKSTSTVHSHLESLERKGYIRRDPEKTRAIEILQKETEQPAGQDSVSDYQALPEYASVPVIGNVAAGTPLLAVEQIESYFPFPVDFLPNAETFMLHVKGESMINCGILDGDYVLVEKKETASDGEIVVALVDDSATVKRFYRENGYIRLQPENDYMDPILVYDNLKILGKVIGVMRFFRNL